ncbi:putative LOC107381128-like protein [Nothobranchius furzeri]|uniref:LOC107381128-like protein n=1 Tax=Nothobranchius furzeri TaxID=105023 RepID=A0A9D3BLX1_NOTFU|nr:putative LOC107381128-like protein [Nothobranchius furzeri]
MKIRVVQIWGFLMTVLGWIFVACTLAMEGWKISAIGGMGGSAVMKVAWYWSSLWRSCYTDSTAVTNCRDFPVLWSVNGYVQIVRGLLMGALSVGMLGFVLSLLGMECTYIGGKEKSKYRKICTGGCCHILSGKCLVVIKKIAVRFQHCVLSISAYAVYATYVSMENLDADITNLRVFAIQDPEQNKPTTASSDMSENTSKSKMSSISEMSSNSQHSDVSSISSRSARALKSGRTARSGRSSRLEQIDLSAGSSASSYESSSRSSLFSSPESHSSRLASSLSGNMKSEALPFVKNTYI